MSTNSAAWLVAATTTPLEVRSAPYTSPREHEIVVKNGAIAVNPVDWFAQDRQIFPYEYPVIQGHDVAGEVVEVGSAVIQFKKADRVCGMALGPYGSNRESNKSSEGAFQEYTILPDVLTCKIPANLSFEQASVLPLCLCTAATGLFQKGYLALEHPSFDPKPTGKTLIIWGGATSVGSNAIQLAVAAGYEVVTTASPKNFGYVKKLGASQALDYSSETIVDDLVTALKGKSCAGVYEAAGAPGAFEACADVLLKIEGVKFLAACRPLSGDIPAGIEAKFVIGDALRHDEVGPAIFEKFIPQALAEGTYVAAPDALVIGKGLDLVQEAYETLKKGVSARKVVVSL